MYNVNIAITCKNDQACKMIHDLLDIQIGHFNFYDGVPMGRKRFFYSEISHSESEIFLQSDLEPPFVADDFTGFIKWIGQTSSIKKVIAEYNNELDDDYGIFSFTENILIRRYLPTEYFPYLDNLDSAYDVLGKALEKHGIDCKIQI